MINISIEDWKQVPTTTIETLVRDGNHELQRRRMEERNKAIENFKIAFYALQDMGVRVYGIYDYSDQLTFNTWDDFNFD